MGCGTCRRAGLGACPGRQAHDSSEESEIVVLMRKALAEFIGTALLLIAVIGSGIAAQRLSPSDTGLELLENAAATGAALVAIILALGSVSGAHLNPAVTLADWILGGVSAPAAAAYVGGQLVGGIT